MVVKASNSIEWGFAETVSTWAYDLFFGVPTDKNILGIASKDAVTKPAKQKEVS